MVNRITQYITQPTQRHYVRIVAFVVLGVSVWVLVTSYVSVPLPDAVTYIPGERERSEEATNVSEPVPLSGAQPTFLSIPAIDLYTTFEAPLGLNEDRTVEVPDSFEKVGWYKYSPTPGERGPAVILGHVDSYEGPAVFYSIGQLQADDEISVKRADGTEARFRVTGISKYEQEGFPSELVYGNIDHAGLRLVTCSGTFDKGAQRYSHNTVVYAELVE